MAFQTPVKNIPFTAHKRSSYIEDLSDLIISVKENWKPIHMDISITNYLFSVLAMLGLLLLIGMFKRVPAFIEGRDKCGGLPTHWIKILFYPFLQLADILSDIFLFLYLKWGVEKPGAWIGWLCFAIILFHSISSFILTFIDMKHEPLKWRLSLCFLQFFQCRILYETSVAFEEFHNPYEIQKLKEYGLFESFPMLVLQVFNTFDMFHNDIDFSIGDHPIVLVSMCLSLISATFAVHRTDMYGLDSSNEKFKLWVVVLFFVRLSDIWLHACLMGAIVSFSIVHYSIGIAFVCGLLLVMFILRLLYAAYYDIDDYGLALKRQRPTFSLIQFNDTFSYTITNYFTFDLAKGQPTLWTNIIIGFELWLFFSIFMMWDWQPEMDRVWIYGTRISLLVTWFILILGTFLMITWKIFDRERYLQCRNQDPETLMDSGEWDLMYSLIQRGTHAPEVASNVFYEMVQNGQYALGMLENNVRPNPRVILEKYSDFGFLISIARLSSGEWPRHNLPEGQDRSKKTEIEELISEMVGYLQDPIHTGVAPMDLSGRKRRREILRLQTKRDKVDKQLRFLQAQNKRQASSSSFFLLTSSAGHIPDPDVKAPNKAANKQSFRQYNVPQEDKEKLLKAFLTDEIIYRWLNAMHIGNDQQNLFTEDSLPPLERGLSIFTLAFQITPEDLAMLMRSFGHRMVTKESVTEFFEELLEDLYPGKDRMEALEARDDDFPGVSDLQNILQVGDNMLKTVNLLRIDPQHIPLYRLDTASRTSVNRASVRLSMENLEQQDLYSVDTIHSPDTHTPSASIASPRKSITNFMRRVSTRIMKKKRSRDEVGAFVFSSEPDKLESTKPGHGELMDPTNVPLKSDDDPKVGEDVKQDSRESSLSQQRKKKGISITIAELCYYMVEVPHHHIVDQLLDILLDMRIEKSSEGNHFIYEGVGKRLKQYFDEKRRDLLKIKRMSSGLSILQRISTFDSFRRHRGAKRLKLEIIDNVKWFIDLEHRQRREIAEKVEVLDHEKLEEFLYQCGQVAGTEATPSQSPHAPYETYCLKGSAYDDYYYIVSYVGEGKIFFPQSRQLVLQQFDMFGAQCIGPQPNGDPCSVHIKFSKARDSMELIRIRKEDLEGIFDWKLPQWVQQGNPWREYPQLPYMEQEWKKIKEQIFDTDVQTKILDACPLFAFLYQFERDVIYKMAKSYLIKSEINNTKRKEIGIDQSVLILQSGLLRITMRYDEFHREIIPSKSHEVIGLGWAEKDWKKVSIEPVGEDAADCIIFDKENMNIVGKICPDRMESIRNQHSIVFSNKKTRDVAEHLVEKGVIENQDPRDMMQWSVHWHEDHKNILLGRVNINRMAEKQSDGLKSYILHQKYIMGLLSGQNEYFTQYLGNFWHDHDFYVMKSCGGANFELEWQNYSRNVKLNFKQTVKDTIAQSLLKAGECMKWRTYDVEDVARDVSEHVLEYIGNPMMAAVKFYAASMITILGRLHQSNVVHRNIHPGAFRIGKRGYLILDGFEDARYIGDGKLDPDPDFSFGRPEYHSPSIVNCEEYGLEADWWAFGVILYQMIHGFVPFSNPSKELLYGKNNARQKLVSEGKSKSFLNVLFNLGGGQGFTEKESTSLDDAHMIAVKLRQHDWFEGFDWDDFDLKRIDAPIKGQAHPPLASNTPSIASRANTPSHADVREKLQALVKLYLGPEIDFQASEHSHDVGSNSNQLQLAYLSLNPFLYTDINQNQMYGIPWLDFQEEFNELHKQVGESNFNVGIYRGVLCHSHIRDLGKNMDILHLTGHGFKGQFLVEDGSGGNMFITDENMHQFKDVFDGVGLVLVMMCNSQYIGKQLIKMGVKHVIAVDGDEKVFGSSILEFVRQFYKKFLQEESPLLYSFEYARRSLTKDSGHKLKLLPETRDERYHLILARYMFNIKEMFTHFKPTIRFIRKCPSNVASWKERVTVDRGNLYTALQQTKNNRFCLVHGPKSQYTLRQQFCNILAHGMARLATFPDGVFLVNFNAPVKKKEEIWRRISNSLERDYAVESKEDAVCSVLKKKKLCLVFTTQDPCKSCWFLDKDASSTQVKEIYEVIQKIRSCLNEMDGGLVLSFDEVSLSLIHDHVDPDFSDFRRSLDNKYLTIFPQLLVMKSIRHAVREILDDGRDNFSLFNLLSQRKMFQREKHGFPYTIQVALQISEMHKKFVGKKLGERYIMRSLDAICRAIDAEKEENLPQESEYDEKYWRKECILLVKLIQQAYDLIQYRSFKILKPISIVYTNSVTSQKVNTTTPQKRYSQREKRRSQRKEKRESGVKTLSPIKRGSRRETTRRNLNQEVETSEAEDSVGTTL